MLTSTTAYTYHNSTCTCVYRAMYLRESFLPHSKRGPQCHQHPLWGHIKQQIQVQGLEGEVAEVLGCKPPYWLLGFGGNCRHLWKCVFFMLCAAKRSLFVLWLFFIWQAAHQKRATKKEEPPGPKQTHFICRFVHTSLSYNKHTLSSALLSLFRFELNK